MSAIKFRVIGKWWTIRTLNRSKYAKKKSRAGSVAAAFLHKRRIDLSPKGTDPESIRHELTHAYAYEMCIHSSDLDRNAMEEFYCELVSKRGKEIWELAEYLYQKIKSKEAA